MDEKSKTELVLVVQQNSISDIIAFLKSLESDVRAFRSLKLWPAVQSKLETVLNIRKALKNYPVDNISLSVSAHSRLRFISDHDNTITLLKRKVTVILLECMHKLHLLGRFLTSAHDIDIISMASVELRRIKDEIVIVSAAKEETMEDTRPEDEIRRDIIGFTDKFEASDRDTPELGTLLKPASEASKTVADDVQMTRRKSKEEGDLPEPQFIKARQLDKSAREENNRLSGHRTVNSWSPIRPRQTTPKTNVSIQISQRHFQTTTDAQENQKNEAQDVPAVEESADDLVGEHPQKRNTRNRTKALFKRIVTHFATIRTGSSTNSSGENEKIKSVLQNKQKNDERKVAKVRDQLGRGHKSEPTRKKKDIGLPSNRSRSDLTQNDALINNNNAPKLHMSTSTSPIVSPNRSPSRSPNSSPLSSPISSPRELSDDESYTDVSTDRSARSSRRRAALYRLNFNPNSAQAIERLGSISSLDSPRNTEWPVEEDGPSNIREVVTDQGVKLIHCATLHKIVERLTSPTSFESKLLTTVMLTYRSFTTPQELFNALRQRFYYAQAQESVQSPPSAQSPRNIRASWRKSASRKSMEVTPPSITVTQADKVAKVDSTGPSYRHTEGNLEFETNPVHRQSDPAPVPILTQSGPAPTLDHNNVDAASSPEAKDQNNYPPQLTTSISMFDLQPKSEWHHIQLRVINVLRRWIEGNFADFDENLITELFLFLEHLRKDVPHLADKLENALMNKIVGVTKDQAKMFNRSPPIPIIPKNIHNITFEELDTLELARQICLRDFLNFSAIQPSELLDGAWSKPKLQYRSPRVLEMIHDSNAMSSWVMSVVVKTVSLKKRVKIYSKFVSLASKLLKCNNFHSMMSIYSGLTHYTVHRLKLTREELPAKTKQKLLKFETLFSNSFSYREYRNALKSINPPAVPHLAIHLRDLIHIEEGNPDLIDGLINVRKRGFVATQIEDLSVFQKPPYNFAPVECIQEFLENLPQDDPDELYQISLTIEPRESTDNGNNSAM